MVYLQIHNIRQRSLLYSIISELNKVSSQEAYKILGEPELFIDEKENYRVKRKRQFVVTDSNPICKMMFSFKTNEEYETFINSVKTTYLNEEENITQKYQHLSRIKVAAYILDAYNSASDVVYNDSIFPFFKERIKVYLLELKNELNKNLIYISDSQNFYYQTVIDEAEFILNMVDNEPIIV